MSANQRKNVQQKLEAFLYVCEFMNTIDTQKELVHYNELGWYISKWEYDWTVFNSSTVMID